MSETIFNQGEKNKGKPIQTARYENRPGIREKGQGQNKKVVWPVPRRKRKRTSCSAFRKQKYGPADARRDRQTGLTGQVGTDAFRRSRNEEADSKSH